MTKFVFSLFVCLFALSAHASADLSNFAQAKAAFTAARAPTAHDLTSALWMATSIASAPSVKGGTSGSWPNGAIPGNGGTDREIGRLETMVDSGGLLVVIAKFTYTDAEIGTLIGETKQTGSVSRAGMVLVSSGDAGSCATRQLCRIVGAGGSTLLCAQSNDDSRPVCTKSYAKGAVAAYVGYRAVHP